MKIITLILIIFCYSLQAQSPITSLDDWNGTVIINSYVQDTNNRLDPFVGTFILNQNGKLWKVVLQKKIQMFNGNYYEDVIIGEYKYTDDTSEIIDVTTLSKLAQNYSNPYLYSLVGSMLLRNSGFPTCENCSPNELRLLLMMMPAGVRAANLVVRRIIVDGQQVIHITKYSDQSYPIGDGEYVLIKQ